MGGNNKKRKSPVRHETTTVRPNGGPAGREQRKSSKKPVGNGGSSKNDTPAAAANKRQKRESGSEKKIDWIANLAKQSASENSCTVPSKEDRIRKREEKKATRLVQREQQHEDQPPRVEKAPPGSSEREMTTSNAAQRKRLAEISKRRLRKIADKVLALRQLYVGQYNNEGEDRKRPRPYAPAAAAAVASKKRRGGRWTVEAVQPRPSDYSGIGLARKSLYIEFADPSCVPKLEEEFQEHIPGFFGKQRTKAMKRQMDGNMLWRQLADGKKNMSKKMKSMSPDERVQAMLDAGII